MNLPSNPGLELGLNPRISVVELLKNIIPERSISHSGKLHEAWRFVLPPALRRRCKTNEMLRFAFATLLFLHGLVHSLGLWKALKPNQTSLLLQPISKPVGVAWGVAMLLFCAAGIAFLMKKEGWWLWAGAAAVSSQLLILAHWQDAKFGTIANLVVLIVVVFALANHRFRSSYEQDVSTSLSRTANIPDKLLTDEDLLPLPVPVQRYLRFAGTVGKPQVRNFRVVFKGKIRKNEQSEWMPLESEQYNFMDIPTRLFYMTATMKHLPVAGYHAFKNGDAFMDIRLFSMFKVQYQAGREMNISETVTFFNDMCCMAPATLIDPRIQWLETDGNRVKAVFTNNGISITAWLIFSDEGQLVNFISDDRYSFDAEKRLPWSTPIKNYKTFEGRKAGGLAETIYAYPAGDLTYAVFETMEVEYNCK